MRLVCRVSRVRNDGDIAACIGIAQLPQNRPVLVLVLDRPNAEARAPPGRDRHAALLRVGVRLERELGLSSAWIRDRLEDVVPDIRRVRLAMAAIPQKERRAEVVALRGKLAGRQEAVLGGRRPVEVAPPVARRRAHRAGHHAVVGQSVGLDRRAVGVAHHYRRQQARTRVDVVDTRAEADAPHQRTARVVDAQAADQVVRREEDHLPLGPFDRRRVYVPEGRHRVRALGVLPHRIVAVQVLVGRLHVS